MINKFKNFWLMLATMVICVIFIDVLTESYAKIHGMMFPVITNFAVTDVIQYSDDDILIKGNIDKLRNCSANTISFYVTDGVRYSPVLWEIAERTEYLGTGENRATSDFVLNIDQRNLIRGNVVVSVLYDCGILGYATNTVPLEYVGVPL
jgi:hypothetical protein